MPLTPLGRRLLLTLFIIGSTVAVISSAIIIWTNYQSGIERNEQTLKQIINSYKDGITYSLWSYDLRQLDAQLQGILNFPSIIYVQVDSNNEVVAQKGDLYKKADSIMVIPLIYNNNDKDINIGYLRINQSDAPLYQSLYQQAFNIFISQISLFIAIILITLWVLYKLVTRRLAIMAKWALEFSLDNLDNELIISDKKTSQDELTRVVNAINHMRETLKEDLKLREKEQQENKILHQQLSLAIDNAELGFCRYSVKTHAFECNANFAQHLGSTPSDLSSQANPIEFITDMITGENMQPQKERVQQLLHGDITSLKDNYLLKLSKGMVLLNINFQIISYIDNLPDKMLIYTTNRTEEYNLANSIDLIKEQKDMELNQCLFDLKNENKKLKESKENFRREVRKLRMAQHPRHIKSLNKLISDHMKHWQACMDGNDYQLWQEFFSLDFYRSIKPIDICQVFTKSAQDLCEKNDIQLNTHMPLSLYAEEDKTVLEFLIRNILPSYITHKTNTLSLTLNLKDGFVFIIWELAGDFSELDLEKILAFKLAEMITQMRYNGDLSYKKSDKQLKLSLTAPFQT